jgi:hypothetical protein
MGGLGLGPWMCWADLSSLDAPFDEALSSVGAAARVRRGRAEMHTRREEAFLAVPEQT